MCTSAGSACSNGVCGEDSIGGGVVTGLVLLKMFSCGTSGGLFAMSIARSVIISIITHHSAGLEEPPNVRRRYMRAHTVVMQMHFAADAAFICIRRYAASRSYFVNNIIMCG